MLFNSIEFWVFFFAVYSLYLLLNHRWQNRMLLLASYFFYGCWDWRFLSLIFISTIVDFFCGLRIHSASTVRRKKVFLIISMCTNLGLLGFFKYFDFFAGSFHGLLAGMGIHTSFTTLNIILPVGISFYTFQTMSYTIDIYRGKLTPTQNLPDFALFVAFFPQLVAGPIERAFNLLPMVQNKRTPSKEQILDGLHLIAWGLFKKVFIADNLGLIVDNAFSNYSSLPGWELLIGLYAFAFQIYCDFSGYSDIARGLAKLMGFELMLNFNLPYFSQNPAEFWRRWHISLSTWLRDYLYIPLGGNRCSKLRTYFNLAVTMLLGGLWHGASWTFILWGTYHGLLLIVHRISRPYLELIWKPKTDLARRAVKVAKILLFFHMTCLGWLIFRAQSLGQIWEILVRIMTGLSFSTTRLVSFRSLLFFTGILIAIQLFQYWKNDTYAFSRAPYALRVVSCGVMFYLFAFYGAPSQAFIYFQF